MTTSYYRNADAAILVYSINDCESLYELQSWSREVMRHTDAVRLLVGNKCDLHDERQISQDIAINFALLENIEITIECSAKEDDNVDFLFYVLAKKLIATTLKNNGNVSPSRRSMLQYPTTESTMSNLFASPSHGGAKKDENLRLSRTEKKQNIFQRFCLLL